METITPTQTSNKVWRFFGPRHTAGPSLFVFSNAIVAVVFIVAWHLVSAAANSEFVPGPLVVWQAFVTVLIKGDVTGIGLIRHALVSIERVLTGFALSCALAVPLGILLGLKPWIYRSSRIVLEPLRFIPPIAWVPIAILLLSGDARYLFIITLGIFFPMLVATMAGVVRTDAVHLDVAKTFGLRPGQRIWKIVLPSALPEIVSGMRIGLGAGWMCIVAAEMIGGELEGLGRMMLNHTELLRVDIIVVGMLTVGLIGLFMNEIFIAVENRVFRWRRAVEL